MEKREIEMKLVKAPTDERKGYPLGLPCDVCSGHTNFQAIVCEGVDEKGKVVRICEACLKEPEQFDAKLDYCAERLIEWAGWLRNLRGRIKAPSLADWKAANRTRWEASETEKWIMDEWERNDDKSIGQRLTATRQEMEQWEQQRAAR